MAETLAKKGAALYFVENPAAELVLATADGNAFAPARRSFAGFHASKLDDTEVYEYEPADLTEEIEEAAAELQKYSAEHDTRRAVERRARELADAPPDAPPTYEEQLEALAELLEVEDFDEIPEELENGELTLTRTDAVVAIWFQSGLSIAAWKDTALATRQEMVATAFAHWIPEPPTP